MADMKPTMTPKTTAPSASLRATTPDAEVAKLRDLLRNGPNGVLAKTDALIQSMGSPSRAQLLAFIKG